MSLAGLFATCLAISTPLIPRAFAGASGFTPAANPSLSTDLANITEWLTDESVSGFAFNGAASFSPPTETPPFAFEWDATFGAGFIPLDNANFPSVGVTQLNEIGISQFFPKSIPFPDFTAHLRMGLPDRWDLAARFSNMTAPTYQVSERTKASVQSNVFGAELRRHFGGGGAPRVTLTGLATLARGEITFTNRFEGQQLTKNFSVDSDNTGLIAWSVPSYGANLTVSRAYGKWTPYGGIDYSYSRGSVRAELRSVFETPLIAPSRGQASARPRAHMMRALFGVTRRLRRMSVFAAGEVLAVGPSAGRSYNLHIGVVAPLRWGRSYLVEEGREARASLSEPRRPAARRQLSGAPPPKRRPRESSASEPAAPADASWPHRDSSEFIFIK